MPNRDAKPAISLDVVAIGGPAGIDSRLGARELDALAYAFVPSTAEIGRAFLQRTSTAPMSVPSMR